MKRSYKQKLNELKKISFYMRIILVFFGSALIISVIASYFSMSNSLFSLQSSNIIYFLITFLYSTSYGIIIIFFGLLQYAFIDIYVSNNLRNVVDKKEENREEISKKESE